MIIEYKKFKSSIRFRKLILLFSSQSFKNHPHEKYIGDIICLRISIG